MVLLQFNVWCRRVSVHRIPFFEYRIKVDNRTHTFTHIHTKYWHDECNKSANSAQNCEFFSMEISGIHYFIWKSVKIGFSASQPVSSPFNRPTNRILQIKRISIGQSQYVIYSHIRFVHQILHVCKNVNAINSHTHTYTHVYLQWSYHQLFKTPFLIHNFNTMQYLVWSIEWKK